jgi:hypothetical protein
MKIMKHTNNLGQVRRKIVRTYVPCEKIAVYECQNAGTVYSKQCAVTVPNTAVTTKQ